MVQQVQESGTTGTNSTTYKSLGSTINNFQVMSGSTGTSGSGSLELQKLLRKW